MATQHYSKSLRRFALALYAAGERMDAITEATGACRSRIQVWRAQAGLPPRPTHGTTRDDAAIREAHAQRDATRRAAFVVPAELVARVQPRVDEPSDTLSTAQLEIEAAEDRHRLALLRLRQGPTKLLCPSGCRCLMCRLLDHTMPRTHVLTFAGFR